MRRPWWQWLGWGLALVASAVASLWSAYFLGSGGLSWVVPTIAAILIPLFLLWYRPESTPTSEGPSAGGITQPTVIMARRNLPEDLTAADLGNVINIVSGALREQAQIDRIAFASNLVNVQYPAQADASERWTAVFEVALEGPVGTLQLLLSYIRDDLDQYSGSAFESALDELHRS